MKYSIGLIIPYFGKLPGSFKIWLKSCEYNPSIDWYVITDDEYKGELPKNVKIIKSNLQEIKLKIKEKIGFDISLDNAYKLCDYKPTYGIVFNNLLKSYDYWGYCDLDMIFGDLRQFITEDVLKKYDKILVKGHLTLYKNCKVINNSFKLNGAIANYKKVFSNRLHYGFDEINGMEMIYTNNKLKQYNKEIFLDILPNNLKFKLKGINYKKQYFLWENGKVFKIFYINGKENVEEYAYIHFQKRSKLIESDIKRIGEAFYITPNGFVNKQNNTEDIKKIYNISIYDTIKFNVKKLLNIPLRIKNKIYRERVYGKLKKD